jgi:hypothetical protein
MDQVAAAFSELRHQRLIGRDRALELGGGAFLDAEEQRDHADALRQHADQLLEPARPQRRLDAAHDAAPAGECHDYNPVYSALCTIFLTRSTTAGGVL